MIQFLKYLFRRKTAREVGSRPHHRSSFIDIYKKRREPTKRDLIDEFKNIAWTCTSINAATVAAFPPKLYVRTSPGQPRPKCPTKALPLNHPYSKNVGKEVIEEVVGHPLLELFREVNPIHNAFDLWELTQTYMEVMGCAYWLLDMDPVLNIPSEIWILPAHAVTPKRQKESKNIVDWYEYSTGTEIIHFPTNRIIAFRNPDPFDPYAQGLSPLRAAYESVTLTSEYNAMRRSIYDNTGVPGVIISPREIISEEERDRLEDQWNLKFRRGGQGRALVAESSLKVDAIQHSVGDLAALAEMKATKEDIANAFQVPMPFLTKETNLANMKAAQQLHMDLAIRPRLKRRNEKINEKLIPLYDSSGRLFVASEDPLEAERNKIYEQQERDLKVGIKSINEVRNERGLPPAPWGNLPFAIPPDKENIHVNV